VLGDRRMMRLGLGALAAVTLAACQGDKPGRIGPGADASAAARRTQRCSAAGVSTVIDSAGIGPVLRGERIAALATRCPVTDTALTLSEGAAERAHVVSVGDRSLVVLTTGTPDTSIIRVITLDPAFKTSGGVGVGSSVQSLRLAHGTLCAAQGEGTFIVMAAGLPGVSFAIDWTPPASRDPAVAETPFPGGSPGAALDAARITRAWVHGVSGACRVGVA
jgi:hypothetical protein